LLGRTGARTSRRMQTSRMPRGLHGSGFRVLRFPDELVIGGLSIVIERIRAALRET
jgi:very-short-patch-repair endonuclease